MLPRSEAVVDRLLESDTYRHSHTDSSHWHPHLKTRTRKCRPIFGNPQTEEALRRERLFCNELGLTTTLFLGSSLRRAVVLFGVDVLRRPVLFVVDLRLLALGQSAAVGLAVRGDLLVDALLLTFELRGFTGG
jgi:hypothetical protein